MIQRPLDTRPEAPGERGCWSPQRTCPPPAPPSSRGHLLGWGSPMSSGAPPGLEESSTCSRQNTPHISHTIVLQSCLCPGLLQAPLSGLPPLHCPSPPFRELRKKQRSHLPLPRGQRAFCSPASSLQAHSKPHLQTPCLPAWLLCIGLEGCKALHRLCLV